MKNVDADAANNRLFQLEVFLSSAVQESQSITQNGQESLSNCRASAAQLWFSNVLFFNSVPVRRGMLGRDLKKKYYYFFFATFWRHQPLNEWILSTPTEGFFQRFTNRLVFALAHNLLGASYKCIDWNGQMEPSGANHQTDRGRLIVTCSLTWLEGPRCVKRWENQKERKKERQTDI